MAQSARIFKKFNKVYPGLSDSCMKCAEKAWTWAVKNPKMVYDQNLMNKEFKPVINTGGYGDSDFSDEFIWAASELYVTTGRKIIINHIRCFLILSCHCHRGTM